MFLATPNTRQELTASPPPFNPLAAGSCSTSPGRSCSAVGDSAPEGRELLAQAREVLALKHALLRREGALMKACRIAGISIADLYEHACR
jgi:hypothetical protein